MSDQVNTKCENNFGVTNHQAAAELSQYAVNLMRERAKNMSHSNTLAPHKFSSLSDEQLSDMSKNKQHPAGLSANQMFKDGARVDRDELAAIRYRQEIQELLHPKPTDEQVHHHPVHGANRLQNR